MSRPLRIEYTGAWYHIMNRGRRGDNVFEGKEDCEIFVALLKEAAELWDVRISAYCLMDNHYLCGVPYSKWGQSKIKLGF